MQVYGPPPPDSLGECGLLIKTPQVRTDLPGMSAWLPTTVLPIPSPIPPPLFLFSHLTVFLSLLPLPPSLRLLTTVFSASHLAWYTTVPDTYF